MAGRRWKATGKVELAWKRLDPPTRDELARLLGLKAATNLSKLNTGDLWMTSDYAERIADVVPGLSVADLGAPVEVVAELAPTVDQLLRSLATDLAEAARKQTTMAGQIQRLQARIRQLEARPWPGEDQATDQVVTG